METIFIDVYSDPSLMDARRNRTHGNVNERELAQNARKISPDTISKSRFNFVRTWLTCVADRC
jgi:hypothetical protein